MNQKHLQELTNAVLKELKSFDIITPELFNNIYIQKIKELNLMDKIKVENISSDDILKKYYKIQEQTKENVKILDQNAKIAKEAIEKKDNLLLNEVNLKMDTLLQKITRLQEEVYLDDLTKTYNRKYLFEEILNNDFFKKSGVITFVDLDKFKYINDNFGHIVGDKVLSMIANLLKELENSTVIRYGGDEFIVISSLPKEKVEKFFKESVEKLSRKSFKHKDGKFKVSFSYGIEEFSEKSSFSQIVEKVDKSMYRQKKLKKQKEQKILETA